MALVQDVWKGRSCNCCHSERRWPSASQSTFTWPTLTQPLWCPSSSGQPVRQPRQMTPIESTGAVRFFNSPRKSTELSSVMRFRIRQQVREYVMCICHGASRIRWQRMLWIIANCANFGKPNIDSNIALTSVNSSDIVTIGYCDTFFQFLDSGTISKKHSTISGSFTHHWFINECGSLRGWSSNTLSRYRLKATTVRMRQTATSSTWSWSSSCACWCSPGCTSWRAHLHSPTVTPPTSPCTRVTWYGNYSLRISVTKRHVYRVTRQVILKVLLTSKSRLRFSIVSVYQNRTFALMSTESREQPDVSPCIQGVPSSRAPGLGFLIFWMFDHVELLPNFHLPKQNWPNSGTPKIKVNPTQVHEEMGYPVRWQVKLTPIWYHRMIQHEERKTSYPWSRWKVSTRGPSSSWTPPTTPSSATWRSARSSRRARSILTVPSTLSGKSR